MRPLVLAGKSLVWERRGLRRVKDVRPGEQILHIDRQGSPSWSELRSESLSRGYGTILDIASENSEILAVPDCQLCVRKQVLRADNITEDHELEIFAAPDYLFQQLDTIQTNTAHEIRLERGVVKATAQNCELLGVLSQCTRVPALWREGLMVIRVPTAALEPALEELKMLMPDFRLVGLDQVTCWTYIRFKSENATLARGIIQSTTFVSDLLRAPYPILHGFACGLLKLRSVRSADQIEIVTGMREINLRNLLYNLFFAHSVECSMKIVGVEHESSQACIIYVTNSDLGSFYRKGRGSRTEGAWTRIRRINIEGGEICDFPTSGESHLSPIVDLALLP